MFCVSYILKKENSITKKFAKFQLKKLILIIVLLFSHRLLNIFPRRMKSLQITQA